MTVKNEIIGDLIDRQIVNTRILNFPRELVFKAWTAPEILAKWWGPKGFTNTFEEFDLKPGGTWKFTMHGPNGVDYKNECVFDEIAEPSRIVFKHLEPTHGFQVTATFEDMDGKTELTFRMLFNTVAECGRVKSYVVEANEQNLDRLEVQLSKMLGEGELLI